MHKLADMPMTLLGGLAPRAFMRRHWQKKPLLIRQAIAGMQAPLTRAELFVLAGKEGVESRLVERLGTRWSLRHGPFTRRQLPPVGRAGWTLLVQGLDLHLDAAHELLSRFRFVPDARLDDLMVSYATDGGGVGAHVDSYDVFLLQVHGQRRWRIGRVKDNSLVDGLPLKILAHFEPEHEWLLEPGDMLYLPPKWAHEGVAVGECMTCSIGFRAATRGESAREVLQRLLDADEGGEIDGPLYRDPHQAPTSQPGRIPPLLAAFVSDAVMRLTGDSQRLACALGEWLSEPKPAVWFDPGTGLRAGSGVALDRRSRMLYDDRHVFINGESFCASGRDAALMRGLCDERAMPAAAVARLSAGARALLESWVMAGWAHAD